MLSHPQRLHPHPASHQLPARSHICALETMATHDSHLEEHMELLAVYCYCLLLHLTPLFLLCPSHLAHEGASLFKSLSKSPDSKQYFPHFGFHFLNSDPASGISSPHPHPQQNRVALAH